MERVRATNVNKHVKKWKKAEIVEKNLWYKNLRHGWKQKENQQSMNCTHKYTHMLEIMIEFFLFNNEKWARRCTV